MNKKQSGFGVVEILVIIVVLILIAVLAWTFFSNQNRNTANVTQSEKTSDTTSLNNASQDEDYYEIEQNRLRVNLDENTKDLIAKVEGKYTYFTLSGFLKRANEAGYSRIVDGKNSCERLAGIILFNDAAEVRAQPTEVTGELIDDKGQPIENRVILLNDGRYAEPINHQASCASNSSFDGSILQTEETNANAAIRQTIRNSFQSY